MKIQVLMRFYSIFEDRLKMYGAEVMIKMGRQLLFSFLLYIFFG